MSLYFGTLAGSPGLRGSTDAAGSAARFTLPTGIAVGPDGVLFVVENQGINTAAGVIRKVTTAGVVTTFAGNRNGELLLPTAATGTAAEFYNPRAVAVDTAGVVYVSDTGNQCIRKITTAGYVTILAGSDARATGSTDGTGTAARFNVPDGVAVDTVGNVYVADRHNHIIRKVTSAGVVTTLAGTAGSVGITDGTGSAARFYFPRGVAVDTAGNVFVADTNNQVIRKITSAGVVTTLAGLAGSGGITDGTGSAARFYAPYAVSADTAGNVFVADTLNHTIRKVTSTGVVTTEAGSVGNPGSNNGLGSLARFSQPNAICVNTAGSVFVADTYNFTIRNSVASAPAVVTLSNLTFTYDGTAKTPSTTVSPAGLAIQLTYSGTAASLSAPITAGSYPVTASVVDDFYFGTTSGVVTISKANQTITFGAIANRFAGSGAFQVFPTASSNLPVSLASSNTAVATVTGNSITPLTAGSTTISATQDGNVNFNAAATVSQVLTVVNTPIAQTISFGKLAPRRVIGQRDIYNQAAALITASTAPNFYFADALNIVTNTAKAEGAFQLVATASSGLPVSFASSVAGVATISGSLCTPVSAGITLITATQAGNSAYSAASAVTQTLVVVDKQFAWLDNRWDLTDLQIDTRTRNVTSYRGNGAVLNIRQGDDHTLCVIFNDANGASINLGPSQLKFTVREKSNRNPFLIETTAFTPANFAELDFYYLIDFRADNDALQRFVAFSGAGDNSAPVPAVGQIEWIYNDKVYSSKPFSVNIVPEVERLVSEV